MTLIRRTTTLLIALLLGPALAPGGRPRSPAPTTDPFASHLVPSLRAQQPESARTEALSTRVSERMRDLQREADQLANQTRTLIDELRRLEVEHDLQTERLRAAQAAVEEADAALETTTAELASLEARRVAQVPDLRSQLVDLYKRRIGGYARLLLEADSVRELGRVGRAVAAMSAMNEDRLAEHQQTLERLRQRQTELGKTAVERAASEADARRAQAAAARAVAQRTALIARIDARRDLNAQLAGELQVANERLRQQMANLSAGRAVERVSLPLRPFRGTLDWPVAGPVTGRFGQSPARVGGGPVRSGIEISAPAGTIVSSVHGGRVVFADAFTGFGDIVILDHGAGIFTVYGYLASASVDRGEVVEVGDEVGRVGSPPAGPPALYFEVRVDDRSVDPVEWLKPR